jgi:hypothetical protein
MWTAISNFLRWIGSLMRRRHLIASRTAITPPPVPGTGRLDFSQPANSGLLLLLEDM